MFLYRKNIILVPGDYDGFSLTKGLLSLDCFDNKTECSLRCYNLFTSKPLILGISINNNLHKISVNDSDIKNFKFVIDESIKNNDDVSCVLIDLKPNDYDIILWGSTQINNGWKSSLQLMLEDELLSKQQEFSETINKPTSKNEVYNNVSNDKERIDTSQYIRDTNSQYKNFNKQSYQSQNTTKNFGDNEPEFNSKDNLYCKPNQTEFINENNSQVLNDNYSSFANTLKQNNTTTSQNPVVNNQTDIKNDIEHGTEIYSYEDEKINALIDKVIDMTEDREYGNVKKDASELTFYERINPQIEKMFANNKEETVLNEILPNSKFCKVEFDDGTGYYVFGIIYDDGTPKYLCYGLPAQRDSEPPTELSNLYQWLPIDATNENGDGYYMMYQDAITGKNISVEII